MTGVTNWRYSPRLDISVLRLTMSRNYRQWTNILRATLQATIFAASFGAGSALTAEPIHPSPESPNRLHQFSARASELSLQALNMLGIRYKRGGNAPESGLDCSGLVKYVFKEVLGMDLPRTSAELSNVGTPVEPSDLQPGDLVFYNTVRRSFSHVGIYLGDNKFIHAPASGGKVRIESMDVGYWKSRFNGARRLIESDSPSGTQQP